MLSLENRILARNGRAAFPLAAGSQQNGSYRHYSRILEPLRLKSSISEISLAEWQELVDACHSTFLFPLAEHADASVMMTLSH